MEVTSKVEILEQDFKCVYNDNFNTKTINRDLNLVAPPHHDSSYKQSLNNNATMSHEKQPLSTSRSRNHNFQIDNLECCEKKDLSSFNSLCNMASVGTVLQL